MKQNVNLLEGSIIGALAKLSLPIMGTSLIMMAYNMVDMIWIGRISSGAVAAVGAAGMYMWLSGGFAILARMGGQVLVGQSVGAGKIKEAVSYARAAIQMGIIFGVIYGVISVVFRHSLIGFFRLNSPEVVRDAEIYLMITCGTVIFSFLNQILTGLMTAMGNSAVTFKATVVGLVINLFLDPLLIFGIGSAEGLGAAGAAIATALAQAIVVIMYIPAIRRDPVVFRHINIFDRTELSYFRKIIKVSFPSSLQSIIFTAISMVIARIIAGWGDAAVAVQKVGSQIESISWMTAEGLGSAVSAFTAQNFGAAKMDRVKKGYRTALGIGVIWGFFTSFILIAFPEFLFKIFITEADVIPMGVDYLRILGVSQLFMCIEADSAGIFQGLGKTTPPSLVGIIFNAMRIPAALFLSATVLQLNGIWWSISISSILKGTVLTVWLIVVFRNMNKRKITRKSRPSFLAGD